MKLKYLYRSQQFNFLTVSDSSYAEIVQDEIDRAEDVTRSVVATSSLLNPADLENFNAADFTVLNVDFGIPLFDSRLNHDVCNCITSHHLWQRETLEALTNFQKSLSERLLKFIRHYVDCCVESKSGSDVAMPTKALLFADGNLQSWAEH